MDEDERLTFAVFEVMNRCPVDVSGSDFGLKLGRLCSKVSGAGKRQPETELSG